ncbi:hypothetical protein [Kitasatospora sp. NPDC088346]|uniref:COG4315 family predicted lipoprotein n=1 Tax=Kitasatospora sp. NPDC088346 TaxID=3364073 RepID=UPI00380BA5F6
MSRTRQAATFTSAALLVVTVGSCATEWRPLPPEAPTPTVTATVTATATSPVAPVAGPAPAVVAPAATGSPDPNASGAASAPASPGATASPAASASASVSASGSASPAPAASAAAGAGSTAGSAAGSGAAVAVASTDRLGQVLVDGQGRTLYVFEGDSTTMSTCYDACASALPPLTTKSFPVAGPGADDGLLGTSLRADGSYQVLYNGRPLYLCAEDTSTGDAYGQEVNRFGSTFYAADASGHSVKASAAPAEDSAG